jgi:hypothetical protein
MSRIPRNINPFGLLPGGEAGRDTKEETAPLRAGEKGEEKYRQPRMDATFVAKERNDPDQRAKTDDDCHGDLDRREMTGKDAGQPKKVKPDQNHDDEPEDKARKSDPAGGPGAPETKNCGKPEWESLDNVTPHQAGDSAHAGDERKNNRERAKRDYDRLCARSVRGRFKIPPHI